MQELEKILEEIDCRFENLLITDDECRKTALSKHDYEKAKYYRTGIVFTERAMDIVKDIIRKHMNDGWVSVEERVPKEEGYKVLVCSKKGNIDTGIYSPYTKQWFIGNISALGKDIIAWRPLPEPYHPERSEHDR